MKVSTTRQRLQQIMYERNLKQVDILNLAKPLSKQFDIKLNKSDLSQYLSGKSEPNQHKLFLLAMVLNVAEPWLMGYNVPRNLLDNQDTSFKRIPLIGTIACGLPILAEENIEEYLNVPLDADIDYALRCKGDSMIDAHINDGDIVYIRSQKSVENGEIAAVRIENEATLKRVFYYREKNTLILKAENPVYEDIILRDEELNDADILGKAIFLLTTVY